MNLVFTNCLVYNGLNSEYTKLAQSFERGFIRIWRKYFPPNALDWEDAADSDRAKREHWEAIQRLGALDRAINDILKPAPAPAPAPKPLTYSLPPGAVPPPGVASSARTQPYAPGYPGPYQSLMHLQVHLQA